MPRIKKFKIGGIEQNLIRAAHRKKHTKRKAAGTYKKKGRR